MPARRSSPKPDFPAALVTGTSLTLPGTRMRTFHAAACGVGKEPDRVAVGNEIGVGEPDALGRGRDRDSVEKLRRRARSPPRRWDHLRARRSGRLELRREPITDQNLAVGLAPGLLKGCLQLRHDGPFLADLDVAPVLGRIGVA